MMNTPTPTAVTSPESLRRRRQAIVVLGWSSLVFFGAWVGLHLAIGIIRGHSLISGHVRPLEPGTQPGHGLFADTLIFAGTFVVLALLIAGWQWLASRLGDQPDPTLSPEEIESQPLYEIDIPVLNKSIVITAIVCLVGSALLGSAVLPAILTKYGW
jgi:hypothetical protein